MHTGDVLVELLRQLEVENVFGVPGGQTLPLYDGIQKSNDISHIITREERTAAYAATAYARMTNKVGVCDATVGPGAAQFTTGLGEAYNSSLPIVAFFSDLPLDWEKHRMRGAASQGFYQLDMVKPFVKWCGKVLEQKMLPEMVRTAFLTAVSGRPGPVVLSIPEDIFKQEWTGPIPNIPSEFGRFPKERPVPELNQIEKAIKLLLNAKKPVIVAGGGAMISQAEYEIEQLSEKLSIPVLQTFSGRGVIADSHQMGVGLVGGLGTTSAKSLLEEADLCFLIGYKSGQNSSFQWTLPTKEQQVIHLDIDAFEIGRVFDTTVALNGDARATLQRLNLLLQNQDINHVNIENRCEWVRAAKQQWESVVNEEVQSSKYSDRLKPQEVMAELNKITSPEDILVCDASFSSGWGAVYYKQKSSGRKIVTPRGMAGLGAGLPMAIGTKTVKKGSGVYLLAGDGGFAYSLGELATLKAYGLKVTMIVLDNQNWGWMEFINKMNFDKQYFDLEQIDYKRVAEGFGFSGYYVTNLTELKDALQSANATEDSVMIHVNTPLWESPVLSFKEYLQDPSKKTSKYM